MKRGTLNDATILAQGLGFVEGPRWHDGRLWFSDMTSKKVMTITTDGQLETVCEVPGQPSGLGWLPDNTLLVVSMDDRRLMRFTKTGGLREVANLTDLASHRCNDMVVSAKGHAYVGNLGFDFNAWARNEPGASMKPAEIILVTPDGAARVVTDGLMLPNGAVISADSKTLIVAETAAARLTAFTIGDDGSLSQRRVWAQFDERGAGERLEDYHGRVCPDGICLDAEDAIWVAAPLNNPSLIRVREGGEITHRLEGALNPYACMLGGPDGRTLFVLGEAMNDAGQVLPAPNGCILALRVDVPHAGLP